MLSLAVVCEKKKHISVSPVNSAQFIESSVLAVMDFLFPIAARWGCFTEIISDKINTGNRKKPFFLVHHYHSKKAQHLFLFVNVTEILVLHWKLPWWFFTSAQLSWADYKHWEMVSITDHFKLYKHKHSDRKIDTYYFNFLQQQPIASLAKWLGKTSLSSGFQRL